MQDNLDWLVCQKLFGHLLGLCMVWAPDGQQARALGVAGCGSKGGNAVMRTQLLIRTHVIFTPVSAHA